MSTARNTPPKGVPWIWKSQEMLASPAWRHLGINALRVVTFLEVEHMAKGGTKNGALLAPYQQLEAFGVGARYITAAIKQAEETGFIERQPGSIRRAATRYALTWLPTCDGTPATNRWRGFSPDETPKKQKSTRQREGSLPVKGKVDGANLPAKGKVDEPESLPVKGKVLLRTSCQGGAVARAGEAACAPHATGAAA